MNLKMVYFKSNKTLILEIDETQGNSTQTTYMNNMFKQIITLRDSYSKSDVHITLQGIPITPILGVNSPIFTQPMPQSQSVIGD